MRFVIIQLILSFRRMIDVWRGTLLLLVLASAAVAAPTNSLPPLTVPTLPDAGFSLLRVTGALALVIGIFLGGVWVFKNWQRVAGGRGGAPKLNIFETRSLGGRHSLHVIGYEEQRFLVAVSPTGVSLLSHLPTAAEAQEGLAAPPTFAEALAQTLKGK